MAEDKLNVDSIIARLLEGIYKKTEVSSAGVIVRLERL